MNYWSLDAGNAKSGIAVQNDDTNLHIRNFKHTLPALNALRSSVPEAPFGFCHNTRFNLLAQKPKIGVRGTENDTNHP